MKNIVLNDNNMSHDEVEMEVIRVKGLIFNSEGKVLLAHNNNTYQFPGGHIEKHETMDDCIIREIKEETGIDVQVTEDPFLQITTYDDNYFNTGKKVYSSIYYYRFFTDELPNYSETHYDELELSTEFNLFYVDFKQLDKFLLKNIESGNMDSNIGREMLYVVSEYNKLFGGIE